MYSSLDSEDIRPNGLKRLARRDLPSTPRTPPHRTEVSEAALTAAVWPELSVGSAFKWFFKGLRWIAILAVLGAAVGAGYSMVAKPKFTAATDLIHRAQVTIDPTEQDRLYRQLAEIFQAEVPATFLLPFLDTFLAHRRLHGLRKLALTDPIEHMDELWLEDRRGQ